MVNGCNGLLSGQLGTQKLRVLSLAELSAGVGDVDYLQLTQAVVAPVKLSFQANQRARTQVQWPLLSPRELQRYQNGQTVTALAVGWVEADGSVDPHPPGLLRGFVSEPKMTTANINAWRAHRIELGDATLYLHLGEKPLAWYYHLLLGISGLLLALGTEVIHHRRRAGELNAGD